MTVLTSSSSNFNNHIFTVRLLHLLILCWIPIPDEKDHAHIIWHQPYILWHRHDFHGTDIMRNNFECLLLCPGL